MFSANHVERVIKRVDVCATLERSKPPIPQRPITGQHLDGGHTATDAVLGRLVHNARRLSTAKAIQIGALNTEFQRFAGAVAERENVVEDAIKPKRSLIDVVVGENVSLRDYG